MAKNNLEFLLVLPCRNEKDLISDMVLASDKMLGRLFSNYKIIVVDASSTDGTPEIAEAIAKKNKHVEVIKNRPRWRKGADVMCGFSKYDAEVYGFMDTDMEKLLKLLPGVNTYLKNEYDVVAASRYRDSKHIDRPPSRLAVSLVYNNMLGILFNDHLTDHQCGFKVFNKNAVKIIQKESVEVDTPWDTEVLIICNHAKLKIKELPINFKEPRDTSSTTNVWRAVEHIHYFVVPVARMFWRFRLH